MLDRHVNSHFHLVFISVLLSVLPLFYSFSLVADEAKKNHCGKKETGLLHGTVRLHSLTQGDFIFGTEVVGPGDMAGGVATLSVFDAYTLDVGGGWRFGNLIYGDSFHVYTRAGFMPLIVDTRRATTCKGATLQVGGKLGYHYIEENSGHEEWLYVSIHELSLGAAIDYTHWYAKHLGIVVGLIIEAGVPVGSDMSDEWKRDYGKPKALLNVAFTFGIAF